MVTEDRVKEFSYLIGKEIGSIIYSRISCPLSRDKEVTWGRFDGCCLVVVELDLSYGVGNFHGLAYVYGNPLYTSNALTLLFQC